jgi:DNA-binding SARP family transcriptional activator/Leucine-rich repeat (LRR) protein
MAFSAYSMVKSFFHTDYEQTLSFVQAVVVFQGKFKYPYTVDEGGFSWNVEEMAVLELSLLGPLEIAIHSEPIEVDSNYVRALLCFLVIEKHRPHRREALAEMFWPEKPEGVARNSLKQALSNLRKALGDRENASPYLLVSRDDVQFNQSSAYQVDAFAFVEKIAACEEHPHDDLAACEICQGYLRRAVDLYRGDFLVDFYLPHDQDFNDWVFLKREVFQRQMSEVLSQLSMIYEAQGDLAHAVEYARQLAELEPWSENNHRNLMRLFALNGMRSAALRQFQICSESLEKELDVAPSNATLALYEEIRAWEPGTFGWGSPPPILVNEVEQTNNQTGDVRSNLPPVRKLSRRSVTALVIVGLMIGIGAFHWLGMLSRSKAAAPSENQAVSQIQPGKATQIIAPSPTATDGIASVLTALPLPTETGMPETTSTPVSTEVMASASSASFDAEDQLQALVALYDQTDGPNWENSEGWLSDHSPCEWYGITCRGGKIVELELDQNNLSGAIPAEIDQLTNLENLNLGNNQIRGSIPPEIGNLTRLRHLTLWGNRELSGPIPPELGNLSDLEDLELANWDSGGSLLSGEIPPELGKLMNLRSFVISKSLLRGPFPVELCELEYLGDLFLNYNQLSGPVPPEIGNMKNLEVLDLGGNDFEGPIPPELGKLSLLHYLALGDMISGEIPAELGNLVRLRYLVLDNTKLSGPLPLSLMNLNLRELTFWGTDVCEPPDEDFQAWLDTIDELWSSDILCPPENY